MDLDLGAMHGQERHEPGHRQRQQERCARGGGAGGNEDQAAAARWLSGEEDEMM
jgi:hypothetical protein